MNALLAAGSLFAALFAEASLDATRVEVGEEVGIEVAVRGGSLSTAAVTPPEKVPEDLDLGPAQGPKIDRQTVTLPGQGRVQVERLVWRFSVVAMRAGTYTIPPFTLTAGGETAITSPLTLRATGSFEAGRFVFVDARVDGRARYVGEPIPVELVAGVAHEWRDRLIQGETILSAPWMRDGLGRAAPPEPETLDPSGAPPGLEMRTSAGGSLTMRPGEETRGGIRYTTWTASRRFVPGQPGRLKIPPTSFRAVIATQVERETPFSDRFFATQTRLAMVEADPITIEVRPLPRRGRPDDFAGLIGGLALDVEASPSTVKLGESLRVRVRVSGEGNLGATALPRADIPGFKRFGLVEEVDGDLPSRTLIYELAPVSIEIEEVPSLRISYFDPGTGRYAVLRSRPIPIEVLPGAAVAATDRPAGDAPAARAPERRIRLLPLLATAAVFTIPPLLLGAGWLLFARRERPGRPARQAPTGRADASRAFLSALENLPKNERAAAAALGEAFAHFLAALAGAPRETFRGVDLEKRLASLVPDESLRRRAARLSVGAERAAFGDAMPPRIFTLLTEARALAEPLSSAFRAHR